MIVMSNRRTHWSFQNAKILQESRQSSRWTPCSLWHHQAILVLRCSFSYRLLVTLHKFLFMWRNLFCCLWPRTCVYKGLTQVDCLELFPILSWANFSQSFEFPVFTVLKGHMVVRRFAIDPIWKANFISWWQSMQSKQALRWVCEETLNMFYSVLKKANLSALPTDSGGSLFSIRNMPRTPPLSSSLS